MHCIKTYINKSRAGHYTVTIRKGSAVLFRRRLIDNLYQARWVAAVEGVNFHCDHE
jgi:hypothetical protein